MHIVGGLRDPEYASFLPTAPEIVTCKLEFFGLSWRDLQNIRDWMRICEPKQVECLERRRTMISLFTKCILKCNNANPHTIYVETFSLP